MKTRGWILVFFVFIVFLFSQPIEAQQCPDLIIQSIKMSPTNPTTSDNITFKVVVQNIGRLPTRPSVAAIRVGGETNPKEYNIPALAPGRRHPIQRIQRLSRAQNYRTTAYADYPKRVRECKENNNSKYISFRVTSAPSGPSQDPGKPPQGCPDLTITRIVTSPAKLKATTKEFKVLVTVRNIGKARAPASQVGLRVEGRIQPTLRIPVLNPGRSHTATSNRLRVYGTTMHLEASVGHRGTPKDCNPRNNKKTVTVKLSKGQATGSAHCYDMRIASVTWSPSLPHYRDKRIRFAVKIKNNGPGKSPAVQVMVNIGKYAFATSKFIPLDSGRSTSRYLHVSPLQIIRKNFNTAERLDPWRKVFNMTLSAKILFPAPQPGCPLSTHLKQKYVRSFKILKKK